MIRKTREPCDVYFHLNRNIGIPRGAKPYPPSFTSPFRWEAEGRYQYVDGRKSNEKPETLNHRLNTQSGST